MEFRVRLFNNTVESNQFKLQIPKSSLQAPTTSLFETLTYSLQKHFNLASGQFVVLSKNGIKLNQDSLIENGQMLQICPTVLGGKVNYIIYNFDFNKFIKYYHLRVVLVRFYALSVNKCSSQRTKRPAAT